jgi:hypothetical protein
MKKIFMTTLIVLSMLLAHYSVMRLVSMYAEKASLMKTVVLVLQQHLFFGINIHLNDTSLW